MLGQRHSAHEGGSDPEGMNGRADIVHEAWQSEGRRAHASPEGVPCLDYEHRATSAGQGDGSSQAIRARADDDRIVGRVCRHLVLPEADKVEYTGDLPAASGPQVIVCFTPLFSKRL